MSDQLKEVYDAADALNDAGYLSCIFSKDRPSRTREAIALCIRAHIAPMVERAFKEGHDEGTQVAQGHTAIERAKFVNDDWLASTARAVLVLADEEVKEKANVPGD